MLWLYLYQYMKGRTQTSAVACDHPYNLFVRVFLFTVLAYATLRCGLKKQEILVGTVGGITGMMDHLITWNFLSLCARRQALNSSPRNVHTQPSESTVPLSNQWELVCHMLQEHDRTIVYYWQLITKCFLLSDYTITIFNLYNQY